MDKIELKIIRLSVKAIIEKDNAILGIKKNDSNGEFYILPGGGQKYGETVSGCLKREIREETGYRVKEKQLLFIRDYISDNHIDNTKDIEPGIHSVDLMFLCELDGERGESTQPDIGQLGVEWLDLNNIENIRLYPLEMRKYLPGVLNQQKAINLGDIN